MFLEDVSLRHGKVTVMSSAHFTTPCLMSAGSLASTSLTSMSVAVRDVTPSCHAPVPAEKALCCSCVTVQAPDVQFKGVQLHRVHLDGFK